jgi:hypothetical protein
MGAEHSDEWYAWRSRAFTTLMPCRAPGAADKALEDFLFALDPAQETGDWFMAAVLGAVFLRRWLADHRAPWPAEALLRLALLILAALRAVSGEPGRPGRAGNPASRGPSAPLVRAHAILTAAPPSSRAPVPAGAPA